MYLVVLWLKSIAIFVSEERSSIHLGNVNILNSKTDEQLIQDRVRPKYPYFQVPIILGSFKLSCSNARTNTLAFYRSLNNSDSKQAGQQPEWK